MLTDSFFSSSRSGFLHEDDLWGVPLLVLANKQDCENVMSLDFIKEGLELHKLRSRDWGKLFYKYLASCGNLCINQKKKCNNFMPFMTSIYFAIWVAAQNNF